MRSVSSSVSARIRIRPAFTALRRLALLAALLGAALSCAARSAAELDRIASVLDVRPGMRVADVGAGDGEWAEDLARRVGDRGCVWATEIDEKEVEEIRERMDRAGLANVRTVVGDARDTGLPAACCESILLRMVYHHFTDPAEMRASLRRALAPAGRIAVIEIEPQASWERLEGVPERGGHGIDAEELIEEMTSDGFEVVTRHDDWEGGADRYCVVFRRRE